MSYTPLTVSKAQMSYERQPAKVALAGPEVGDSATLDLHEFIRTCPKEFNAINSTNQFDWEKDKRQKEKAEVIEKKLQGQEPVCSYFDADEDSWGHVVSYLRSFFCM